MDVVLVNIIIFYVVLTFAQWKLYRRALRELKEGFDSGLHDIEEMYAHQVRGLCEQVAWLHDQLNNRDQGAS